MRTALQPLRLEIDPVIQNAEGVHATVLEELAEHKGLARAAEGVSQAAREAHRVSQKLQRPFGLHRLPAAFLALTIGCLLLWVYLRFFRTATLSIALPDRDAHALRDNVAGAHRVQFNVVPVVGSREAVESVERGAVDLAFVQGGMPINSRLPRLETPTPEVVLMFLRTNRSWPTRVQKVLTSVKGEGSHTVALDFFRAWGYESNLEFVHDWRKLSDKAAYEINEDIEAVFVVKDPADPKTLLVVERLAAAGFQLVSPDLGVRATKLNYLSPTELSRGFLQSDPAVPLDPVRTYSVATYLVAREGLTPRLLSVAGHLIDGAPPKISDQSFEPNVGDTWEIFQGVDALLGILINIVLAFLALLGLEILAYRKRFHELNSLISLISVHQSSKDVLGLRDENERRHNLLYLSLCSDLLGLISMIAGYYTQENSSLLFNSLTEIIHQRCDGLKINIQLKILHATINVPPAVGPVATPPDLPPDS